MPIAPKSQRTAVGAALRRMREGAGLSYRELGKLVGVSHAHLIRIEQGERDLSQALSDAIAHVFADRMNGRKQ